MHTSLKQKINLVHFLTFKISFQWPMGVIYLQPFKLRKSLFHISSNWPSNLHLTKLLASRSAKKEKTRFTQIEKKTWLQLKFHLNDSNCYRLLFTTRCYCFPVKLYGGPYMQCTNNNFSAKKKTISVHKYWS